MERTRVRAAAVVAKLVLLALYIPWKATSWSIPDTTAIIRRPLYVAAAQADREHNIDQARERLPDYLIECAENYEYIIGTSADNILLKIWRYPEIPRDNLESWMCVRRGRDLFLKNRGSFDIMHSYRAIMAKRNSIDTIVLYTKFSGLQRLCLELGENKSTKKDMRAFISNQQLDDVCRLMIPMLKDDCIADYFSIESNHFKLWLQTEVPAISSGLVSVLELQAEGYFGTSSYIRTILHLPSDWPMKQHFELYLHSWLKPRNKASIDELHLAASKRIRGEQFSWPENWRLMEPEQLLDAMREMERERMKPDLILYSHLDDLQDSGRLRVLRSNMDLYQAGLDLKNCALNYADDVEGERAILVTIDSKRKPEKSVALGMIRYRKSQMDSKWSQIYLACNKEAPPDVKQQFYDYEPSIREWHRKRYCK